MRAASCEIGLPPGDQLKKQIADLFATTDENIYGHKNQTLIEAVMDRPVQRNHVYVRNDVPDYDGHVAIRGAARRIRRGLPLALSGEHRHPDLPATARRGSFEVCPLRFPTAPHTEEW